MCIDIVYEWCDVNFSGLPTLSGFAHPAETVDDLEFKDNSFNGEQMDKQQLPYNGYQYNSPGKFFADIW